MISVGLLMIGLFGQWLFGLAIARLLLGVRGNHEPASDGKSPITFTELAGLGLVLGIGGTAEILFLWSLCGGALGPAISWAITIVGFVGGTIVMLGRRSGTKVVQDANLPADQDSAADRAWSRGCQILVACLFASTLFQTLMRPQHLWDERSSFAIKGIVLAEDGSINSRDLSDPNFVQYHPRYPLLIPLAEQHVHALIGSVDDRLAKIVFPLLYLGMVLTIAGALERSLSAGQAWTFGLMAATIPSLVPWEYGFPCGQADAPTGCYHGLAMLYLWVAWQQISSDCRGDWVRPAVVSGICGALAAFTKDEGLSYLLVDAMAVLFVLLISQRRTRGLTVLCSAFGVAVILTVPWILHRRGLPLTTEANYFGRLSVDAILRNRANLEWEVPHLFRRMFWESRTWGLQWWLMLLALLAVPRRAFSGAQLVLLLDVVGSLMSLMLAGILAETEVSEHIGGSSHRYLMQIAPVAIVFAAGQLKSIRRSSSTV